MAITYIYSRLKRNTLFPLIEILPCQLNVRLIPFTSMVSAAFGFSIFSFGRTFERPDTEVFHCDPSKTQRPANSCTNTYNQKFRQATILRRDCTTHDGKMFCNSPDQSWTFLHWGRKI